MTTYRVEVTREDKWWIIRVPDLVDDFDGEPVLTQARRLDEVETEARDLICLTADVAPSGIDVDIHVEVPGVLGDLSAIRRQIAADRAEARAAEERAIAESRMIAHALSEVGVPIRDIASVAGVSFQRAQQLVREDSVASS